MWYSRPAPFMRSRNGQMRFSRIVESVDSAPIPPAGLDNSLPYLDGGTREEFALLGEALLDELCLEADISAYALERSEFAGVLHRVAEKCHYNLPPNTLVTTAQAQIFWRGLRLRELALAHACAAGREEAWRLFLVEYREPLTRAACAITGSSGDGQEMADALYSELYGLDERQGIRRSPLRSYLGRGSFMGWLRATLAQRHVDRHRRTHREAPLGERDFAAAEIAPAPQEKELTVLNSAVATSLRELEEEERFMLSAWFLDGRTLQQIARILRVHEATVSRKIKRLTEGLRKSLLRNLQKEGLSRRAAEEALGTDPRDITVNLRNLLQSSQSISFQEQVRPGLAADKA